MKFLVQVRTSKALKYNREAIGDGCPSVQAAIKNDLLARLRQYLDASYDDIRVVEFNLEDKELEDR